MASSTSRHPVAAWTPALCVLRDKALLVHVAAFLVGMPVALRGFWMQLDAEEMRQCFDEDGRFLLLQRAVAESGSTRDLELLERVRLRTDDAGSFKRMVPNHTDIAMAAANSNRADVLQWTIDRGNRLGESWIQNAWNAALDAYKPRDLRVLELLMTHAPIAPSKASTAIARFAGHDRVDGHLVRWLTARFPLAKIPLTVAFHAAQREDADLLRLLEETSRADDIHMDVCVSEL